MDGCKNGLHYAYTPTLIYLNLKKYSLKALRPSVLSDLAMVSVSIEICTFQF